MEVTTLSELEKRAAERLERVLPLLSDYNKGRIAGIGEGLAMGLENASADCKEPDGEEERQS